MKVQRKGQTPKIGISFVFSCKYISQNCQTNSVYFNEHTVICPLLDYECSRYSRTHITCPKLLRNILGGEVGLTFRPGDTKNFLSCSKLQDNIIYNCKKKPTGKY